MYSPDEAPWPGWLFYAATQLNPRNSIWRDASALAAYVTRCQSVLQSGDPDSDVLLYWPVYDRWHDPQGMLSGNTVHYRQWFENAPVGALAKRLWDHGFTFDYVSDAQLAAARAEGEFIRLGGRYRAIMAPPCQHMPVQTLAALIALAEAGATIIFSEHLPGDVPGLGDLDGRRAQFRGILERIKPNRRSARDACWSARWSPGSPSPA